ncbi:type IV pilus assembly protein PilQ [Desulfacinum hydrothermale DSM 13146]|uniref:Type IV pilus assembly protein PilQ n=1 Tax=Desulfacinum hydrothermale DSM 13146 TaxID=1121390 RepID=A0A1W1X225_9BACT|nr:type IV pilus secretin PilQ [Desulfacinum hydrothermale]SMC17947.1 type IV pilus assembly protein PilQ [Desulfacinum hydrothermale DSM 13146]
MKTQKGFFRNSIRTLISTMAATMLLAGCVTASQQARTSESPATAPAPGTVQQTDVWSGHAKVFGVQAYDREGRTELRIVMDRPAAGHRVVRRGSHEFTVELDGVETQLGGGSIPTASKKLIALRANATSGGGFLLRGRVVDPIGRLEARTVGKDLVVELFPAAPDRRPASAGVNTVQAPRKRTPSRPATVVSRRRTVRSPKAMSDDAVLGYKRHYRGKPISLDLQNADVQNVLRLLADISGMNIVLEPDVAGKVTLKVENVPWDQVLDMVLMMNRLGREEIGGVIRIARQEKLKAEWKERQDRIKAQQELLRAQKDLGELGTVYLQVNYADPDSIASKIKEIASGDGKVSVDQRTNLILYTDYPARIAEARDILARLDRPTRQVLIEARIVQINSNASRELGIDWGFNLTKTTDHVVSGEFAVNHPVAATSSASMTIGRLVGTTLWNLDLRLSAAETAGQGKVIAAPRVLTMNHVKATISQGTQIPYQEKTGQGNTSVSFKDATLELQVTPHITPDGRVRLQIQAKQDSPNLSITGGTGEPAIDTRRIDTELLVDDGSTVVIGGIIKEEDSKEESRTPGVHRIPILGSLFKSKSVTKDKSELMIFIHPRIVDLSDQRAGSQM